MRFIALFFFLSFSAAISNAQKISTWGKIGTANWNTIQGVTQADKGTGFLVSPSSYKDFTITLEFWVDEEANSGVFLRCSDPKNIDQTNAYEVNIYDKRPNQKYRTGAIVDVAKPETIINTANKWNTYEITAKGNQLIVKLNNTVTVDTKNSTYSSGPIALQYAAGKVKFRNVKIKAL